MSFIAFEKERELIDEVKRKLGHPIVKVEVDDSQWTDIIKQTKRWFFAKKSVMAMTTGRFVSGCDNAIPFEDIDPVNGVYKIIDVYFDESIAGVRGIDNTYYEILPFGYPVWGSSTYAFGSGAYNRTSYIYQVFTQLEQRRKVYGADLDWTVQEDYVNGHKLYMTPNNRTRTYGILYKPKTLPLEKLEGRDANLIFRYALAETKETLGTIRNKYKDYPSAGGTISMDGSELLDQAKEEKEKLEEEIAGSQGPIAPLFF